MSNKQIKKKIRKSPFSVMSKLNALEYLIENSVYGDEWQGAGMWEAVLEMMKYEGKIRAIDLDKLLKEAENR